jgi:hypothetical protein
MQPKYSRLSCFAALLLLLGAHTALAQSTSFSPFKITLFEDAAQIASKGIVNFEGQKADIPLNPILMNGAMDMVSGSTDIKVRYFKVRQDSVVGSESVGSWAEVLQANMGKRLTIVYTAGMELDEVTGEARVVNMEKGMLLLHGGEDSEYFIPFGEIKQVIVQGQGNFSKPTKVPKAVLEIGIDKDQPFVPMQLYSLTTSVRWTPIGRIRILGSDKALLQLSAVIQNDLMDLSDIDLELSASKILSTGHQNGENLEVGKLNLRQGERLSMTLLETEMPYSAAYQCEIPWSERVSDGRLHRFPVENIIRFDAMAMPGLAVDSYHVIDENNRQLAQIGVTQGSTKQMELRMGEEKLVHVNVLEREVKKSSKVEKIGELSYQRVSIEGKITCLNAGTKFSQIQVSREMQGEVIEPDKAKVEDVVDEPGLKTMTWRLSLDKGAKREINYKYDAFIPVEEK